MSESTVVGLARPNTILSAFDIQTRLSIAELVALAFFAYMTLDAFVFHLAARDVGIILMLNTLTIATLMALRRNRERAPWLIAAADLFPAVLILVAYRESGLLLAPDPSHHLDLVFIRWDRILLQSQGVQVALQWGTPWLQRYLELAYLLCYPLVPLGVGAVHLAIQRSAANVAPPSWRHWPARGRSYSRSVVQVFCGNFEPAKSKHAMDDFWATVLLATLFCYAVYPFFPLTPPRVLFGDVPGPHVEPLLRQWNFWLLDHYSVQACIFPSGHVAAVTAAALAVRKHSIGPGSSPWSTSWPSPTSSA